MDHKSTVRPGRRRAGPRRTTVTTTVYMTIDQDEALRALSDKTGRPASAFVRDGIDLVLAKHRPRPPRRAAR